MSENYVPCATCRGGDFYEQRDIALVRAAEMRAYAVSIGDIQTPSMPTVVVERPSVVIDVAVPDAVVPAEAAVVPVEVPEVVEAPQVAPDPVAAATEAVSAPEKEEAKTSPAPKEKKETAAAKKKRLAAEAAASVA